MAEKGRNMYEFYHMFYVAVYNHNAVVGIHMATCLTALDIDNFEFLHFFVCRQNT